MKGFIFFTNRTGVMGVTLGSLLAGAALVPAAIAAPVAQVPDQQPMTNETITIPSTGTSVQLSQIRVANVPPPPQNPCPSIYYEAPFNQYVVVPQVCRPNLITQQLDQLGMLQSIRATATTNIPGANGGTTTPYTPGTSPNPGY